MIPDPTINRLAGILIFCLLATPVLADVTGPARVIDGDTIEHKKTDENPGQRASGISENGLQVLLLRQRGVFRGAL